MNSLKSRRSLVPKTLYFFFFLAAPAILLYSTIQPDPRASFSPLVSSISTFSIFFSFHKKPGLLRNGSWDASKLCRVQLSLRQQVPTSASRGKCGTRTIFSYKQETERQRELSVCLSLANGQVVAVGQTTSEEKEKLQPAPLYSADRMHMLQPLSIDSLFSLHSLSLSSVMTTRPLFVRFCLFRRN